MKECVIITGTRWNTPSDAATFPAWHFYQSLKHRMRFTIWAEEIDEEDDGNNSVHSLRRAIPPQASGLMETIKVTMGKTADRSRFSTGIADACEAADLIFLLYAGGTNLTDMVLRNWGSKTLVHLTDNLVVFYTRSGDFRYALRAAFSHLHISRLPAQGVVFVSETDRKWFARMFPWRGSITHAVPLGVDSNVFSPAKQPTDDPRAGCRLLFAGDLSYEPNMLACKYIVDSLLPSLPRDATMIFGGRRPPDFLRDAAASDARIQITGFVPDMADVYRAADIFIAPMFHGAGMQNKLLEAAATGLPCVTTPICAAAFPVVPPNFVIARDTAEFITGIRALAEDSRHRRAIGEMGRAFVETHHSWDARATALLVIAGISL